MLANHKRITIPIVVGRVATTATLEPGQVLIGRHSLAKTLKMPPSTIRNRLHFLEEHEYVDIKKDKHYSIVTICDWDGWVKYEEKKRTTKRTSRGQAEDTEDHSYHDESGGRDSSGSEIVDLTV